MNANTQTMLEAELEAELFAACKRSERVLKRYALTTRELISKMGAVRAAKHIVQMQRINDGFVDLLLKGKAKLTVEYIVTKKKYAALFGADVQAAAWNKVAFACSKRK